MNSVRSFSRHTHAYTNGRQRSDGRRRAPPKKIIATFRWQRACGPGTTLCLCVCVKRLAGTRREKTTVVHEENATVVRCLRAARLSRWAANMLITSSGGRSADGRVKRSRRVRECKQAQNYYDMKMCAFASASIERLRRLCSLDACRVFACLV